MAVYPTETFYALGAAVGRAEALARIIAIKGRPQSKPLPVIIGDVRQLAAILAGDLAWPGREDARRLMALFWPGSLSMVVPGGAGLAAVLKDPEGGVSVRLSPHPQARALCLLADSPVCATSANLSGRPAVTDLRRLDRAVRLGADAVLPGRPRPAGGLASTVVRPLGGGRLTLHRAGAVPVERLIQAGFNLTEP